MQARTNGIYTINGKGMRVRKLYMTGKDGKDEDHEKTYADTYFRSPDPDKITCAFCATDLVGSDHS